MIDSIKIRSFNPIEDTSFLSITKDYIDKKTGEIFLQGNYRNLKFFINGNGFMVKNSLSRFYQGDGFTKNLSLDENLAAIKELSELTKTDLMESKVYEVEFGSILELEDKVQKYTNNLRSHHKLERNVFEKNVYFNSKNFGLAFYDVVKNWKQDQKLNHDKSKEDLNLLKYENRYMKTRQTLKYGNKVKDILNPRGWNRLLDRWLIEYNRISKSALVLDPNLVRSPRKFIDCVAAKQIQSYDSEFLKNSIEHFKGQTRCRLKSKIKEIENHPDFLIPYENMNELDEKINQIYEEMKV